MKRKPMFLCGKILDFFHFLDFFNYFCSYKRQNKFLCTRQSTNGPKTIAHVKNFF